MDWLARYKQLLVNMLGTVRAMSAWAKMLFSLCSCWGDCLNLICFVYFWCLVRNVLVLLASLSRLAKLAIFGQPKSIQGMVAFKSC